MLMSASCSSRRHLLLPIVLCQHDGANDGAGTLLLVGVLVLLHHLENRVRPHPFHRHIHVQHARLFAVSSREVRKPGPISNR
jgi:hypothetical protein